MVLFLHNIIYILYLYILFMYYYYIYFRIIKFYTNILVNIIIKY